MLFNESKPAISSYPFIMKHHLLILALILPLSSFAGISLTIKNPNNIDLKDAPVVISLDRHQNIKPQKRHLLSVFIDKQEVSSQLDDLDKDGIPDELVFLADLKAGERKKISLKYLPDDKRTKFSAEVYSSLILKGKDGSFNFTEEVSSGKNDMYNKLHHHGVAFESALMAYRIYFDNKSTIDVYGKKKYRLELPDTHWYPSEEQLKAGYGDDILLVSGWVGVGTVKGWSGQKATHIDKFDKRTQRIVVRGNIRIIAESEVTGWEYEGKKTDMTVRYTLYARHRDAIVEVSTSTDIDALSTGVQKIGNGPCFESNQLVGSWGSWYPQPDSIKYSKETAGLGVYLPEQYKGKQVMAGADNLIVFPCKANEKVTFHLTTIAAKEENQPIQSAEDFFKYLDTWKDGLKAIIIK